MNFSNKRLWDALLSPSGSRLEPGSHSASVPRKGLGDQPPDIIASTITVRAPKRTQSEEGGTPRRIHHMEVEVTTICR